MSTLFVAVGEPPPDLIVYTVPAILVIVVPAVSAIDALYLSKISNIQETVVSPNYNPHSDKMELSQTDC